MRFSASIYNFFIFCWLVSFVFSYDSIELPIVSRKAPLLMNVLSKMLKSFNFTMVGEDMRLGSCSKASCLACHAITALYLSPFYTKEAMVSAVRGVCISFRISSEHVCRGMVESFKDDLDFIRHHTKLNRREICGILFGISCARTVTPNLNWSIAIPSPHSSNDIRRSFHYHNPKSNFENRDFLPSKLLMSKPGLYERADRAELVSFIQVTDMHVDPYYMPGTNADCKEPLCCRFEDGIPIDPLKAAGIWGDYRNCDLPINTFRNALKHISTNHPQVRFWIWTGDNGPHDIWNASREEILSNVRFVTSLIKQYAQVPVYPVVGNHEGVPVNSFPPPEVKGPFSISWLYHSLAELWAEWLPEDALRTFRYGGYYSVSVQPGLRIIAMNTNYCTRLNPWTMFSPVDPANQLKWLVHQLQEAETANEKVHILGHIPPDSRECTQAWLFNFLRIMERYEETIVAQYYGHTHRDEFRVLYSPYKQPKPVSVAFIGPSMTPYTENNPAYRVYLMDSSGYLSDYSTFYFNLSEANTKMTPPNWKLGYSAASTFKLSDLGPKSWHNFVERLQQDEHLFQSYHSLYYRWSEVKRDHSCYGRCREDIIDDLKVKHPLLTKPKRLFNSRNI